MTRRHHAWLVASLAAVLGSGCPSLSTLQTVETVPQGKIRFAVGLEAEGISNGDDSATVPQAEFAVRYGLTDNLDIGGKLYGVGAEIGMKWQYLSGSFDAALAPALSFLYFSSNDESISLLWMHLPVLFGADLTDRVTLGFGPKFLYGLAFADIPASSELDDGLFGGLYVGLPIRIGDAFWIAPELNIYTPFTDDPFGFVWWQGGIGLMFGGGPEQDAPAGVAPPLAPAGY